MIGLTPAIAAAGPADLALTDVTVLHVEEGSTVRDVTILVSDGRIVAMGPGSEIEVPAGVVVVSLDDRVVIPTLWDMHTHSFRDERWTHHLPLYLAFGVTGLRDCGTHLASALAHRRHLDEDPLAPDVSWSSPPLDGVPPFLSFALVIEDPAAGRAMVRALHDLGFDAVKVYDGLSEEAFLAIADEARRVDLAVEGHVPLHVHPSTAIEAGLRLIDHLTLLVEACIPGTLDWIAASAAGSDSMTLLMDGRLAASLDRFDEASCSGLLSRLAAGGVWQVPTLVQMRGFFFADDPGATSDPRGRWVPPGLLEEWHELGRSTPPEQLAAGRAVFRRQLELVGSMHRAGVPLLAGTDTSSETWVFAGASLHDELALLVDAGLSPLEALRAATSEPRRWAGRQAATPLIAVGEPADLIVLDADPSAEIRNTTSIHAVLRRGRLLDRAALDALIASAQAAAAAR